MREFDFTKPLPPGLSADMTALAERLFRHIERHQRNAEIIHDLWHGMYTAVDEHQRTGKLP